MSEFTYTPGKRPVFINLHERHAIYDLGGNDAIIDWMSQWVAAICSDDFRVDCVSQQARGSVSDS